MQSWRMFNFANKGAPDDRLFVADAAPAVLESAPIESVAFVRDEVANMVWGIETVVQLPDGSSRRGWEAAVELHARYQSAVVGPAAVAAENDAKIKYRLMSSVAENWIPLIPVQVEGDNREIQLQRAAMPRLLHGEEGTTPQKIVPRTQILRQGLEASPAAPYYIAEEEVERAGTIVEMKWRRCRWRDGRVVLWLGHRRKTGHGEASGGLAFDRSVPKRAQPET